MADIKSSFTGEFFERDSFMFNEYPIVQYDMHGDGKSVAIRNFLKRFGFRDILSRNISALSKWIIRDEDTPEIIAHKLYDSTHYYWIVLMLNKIYDPYFSWPLTDRQLYSYCAKKYGVNNIYDHHHYIASTPSEVTDYPDGTVVSDDYAHKNSVSNYQYEFQLNETKRSIILLKPEFLAQLLNEWDTIKKSNFTKVVA